MVEADGGTSEIYRGALTVAGLRYGFNAGCSSMPMAPIFVSDIARFEPVEWQTGIRVA